MVTIISSNVSKVRLDYQALRFTMIMMMCMLATAIASAGLSALIIWSVQTPNFMLAMLVLFHASFAFIIWVLSLCAQQFSPLDFPECRANRHFDDVPMYNPDKLHKQHFALYAGAPERKFTGIPFVPVENEQFYFDEFIRSASACQELQSSLSQSSDVESVVALAATIALIVRTRTPLDRVGILYLYLRSINVNMSRDAVFKLFRIYFDFNPGAIVPEFQSTAGVRDNVNAARTTWKSILTSDLAKQLRKVVQIVASLKACSENPTAMLFDVDEATKLGADPNLTGLTLIDVVLDACDCILNRLVDAVETRSVMSLFSYNKKQIDVEQMVSRVKSSEKFAMLGNFENTVYLDKAEYITELDACIVALSRGHEQEQDKILRRWYLDKMTDINDLRLRFLQSETGKTLRIAPYAVLLYGGSGVGKSDLAAKIAKQILACNDYSSGKENVTVFNMKDKYQSDYRPSHNAVILDDVANTKHDKTDVDPAGVIIQLINNTPTAALQADVARKGLIMLEPKVVVATTNKKTIDASVFSNEPISVLRRFEYVVTVEVKPEYCKPGQKMLDSAKAQGVANIWDITLEKAVLDQQGNIGFALVDKTDIHGLLKRLSLETPRYYENQFMVCQRSSQIYDAQLCEHNIIASLCTECIESSAASTSPTTREGIQEFQSAREIVRRFLAMRYVASLAYVILNVPYLSSVANAAFFAHERLPFLLMGILSLASWIVQSDLKHCLLLFLLLYVIAHYACITYISPIFDCSLPVPFVGLRTAARAALDFARSVLGRRKPILFFGMTLVAFGSLLYMMRSMKEVFAFQSVSEGEEVPPDVEQKVNYWTKVERLPIPTSHAAETTTFEDLVNFTQANVRCIEVDHGDFVQRSNIFGVKRNIWAINAHVWKSRINDEFLRMKVHRGNVEHNANTCEFYLYKSQVWECPGTDLVFFNFMKSSTVKDMTPWMIAKCDINKVVNGAGKILWRNNVGVIETIPANRVKFRPNIVAGATKFYGYGYELSRETFNGLCGAPFVLDSRAPFIMGFHFAGTRGSNDGSCMPITVDDVSAAEAALAKNSIYMRFNSSGNLPLETAGVEFGPMQDTHYKSVSRYLSDGATLDHYGKHSSSRRTFRSNIVPSLISDRLGELCDQPRQHDKPQDMNGYQHFRRHLEAVSHINENVNQNIMTRAATDLRVHVRSLCVEHKDEVKNIVPLREGDNLAGVQGKRFLDGVIFKTSAGWPFNCPKTGFVEMCEDVATSGQNRNISLGPIMRDEVKRMEESYLRGERCYPIFRANLKDEPTKIGKSKVRVFAGAPFAFAYLVRKYFLTTAVFIQNHPIAFECAVGVNAHGPEWTELMRYVESKGKERGIAGDYAAYDTTCPATFMSAAYKILFDIIMQANSMNNSFSGDDIVIIEGIVTDLCNPVYEHNGDLLGVVGSNPSGHNLTVIVNNIANSLFMRYAYYQIASDEGVAPPSFRDTVALLCYGDDNKMTVAEGYPWFNHTRIASALADISVTYTMADKEAESVPYISVHDADFLKRGAVYDEEFDMYLAPLKISSIFKSLHCRNRNSEIKPTEHAGTNAGTAAFELMFHGREVYDKYVPVLDKVLAEVGAEIHVQGCGALPSYDKQRELYRAKYCPDQVEGDQSVAHGL